VVLSSLRALTAHLGQFPAGRKTLLVVSNGIAASGYRRVDRALPGIDAVARAANRTRVAIYALRPSPDDPPASTDTTSAPTSALVRLADQTTGFVLGGSDDVPGGLRRMLRDASRYYLVTITPPADAVDQRFRDVSVTVARPGATVRARRGYEVSLPEPSSRRTGALTPETATIVRHSSALIRTWFGQSAADQMRTRVDFVWEVAPRLAGVRGLQALAARVSARVTTLDGTEVFAGVSSPSRSDLLAAGAQRTELSFESPPGPLLVQMDILDATGRSIDHDVRDLVVDRFAGPLAFGTAAVYRARTVHELAALAAGGEVAPVAAREFSRTEHLVIRIPVLSRVDVPTVTARLSSALGGAMRDLPVTMRGPRRDTAQIDLPLASLASGSYVVEFTAHADDRAIIDRTPFIVRP
jgi:hypothetical protein